MGDDHTGNLDGLFIYEIDRASGQLEPVNQWTDAGNAQQGERGPDLDYIHDVEAQDDLVTRKPTVYRPYWGNGLRVLDASDPENLTELGHYEMSPCHCASPAPALMETESGTKRVAVASQELSSSKTSTGNIHFIDTSGISEADAAELYVSDDADPTAKPTMLQDLDTWVWQSEPEADAAENSRYDSDVDFSNSTLSPHNPDIAVDDVGEESDGATVGPAEVSTDGGETWRAVPGTLETNFVIGQSTNLLFGTAAATTGVAAHQRDRIADRARELFGREA